MNSKHSFHSYAILNEIRKSTRFLDPTEHDNKTPHILHEIGSYTAVIAANATLCDKTAFIPFRCIQAITPAIP